MCPTLFETPWTVAHRAPLSMGFPRQESWSGLPFPSPGDLPNPGVEPASPIQLACGFVASEPAGKPLNSIDPPGRMPNGDVFGFQVNTLFLQKSQKFTWSLQL